MACYQLLLVRFWQILDRVLCPGCGTPITNLRLVGQRQRPATAQIFGTTCASLVFLQSPDDIKRNSCVQTTVRTTKNVETVLVAFHARERSGVATGQRIAKHAKRTALDAHAVFRSIRKSQHNLTGAIKLCCGFVQGQGERVTQ